MAEEPSAGELHRLYEGLRSDTRQGFSDVNARLDKMPTSEVMLVHLQGLQRMLDSFRDEQVSLKVHVDTGLDRLSERMDAEFAERDKQRQRDIDGRRWLTSAVVIPILLSLIALAAATGVIG